MSNRSPTKCSSSGRRGRRNTVTDAEFRSLQPGDKISVDGYQIAFDALVTGLHNNLGEIPIQVVAVYRRAENIDYVYKDYMHGHRTVESNRPALLRGWLSDGVRR